MPDMDNSTSETTNQSKRLRAPLRTPPLLLGVIGLAATIALLWVGPFAIQPLASTGLHTLFFWMALAVLSGTAGRAARRKVFFGKDIRPHQAFAYDIVFQAAIAFNPQLEYPGTETAFLRAETGLSADRVANWFAIRSASAAAIPLALVSAILISAGQMVWALACACAAALWVWNVTKRLTYPSKSRFLAAELLGVAGTLAEGLLFAKAAMVAAPGVALWQILTLYLICLMVYELSPIPFALGLLEGACLLYWSATGVEVVGLVIPLIYRLLRAVTAPLAVFYLPRYKLNLRDVFNPSLALALSKSIRPPDGWAEDVDAEAPLLSVVIPAYNEVQRLPHYLPDVIAYCDSLPGTSEVIVVDDGSTDKTADYVNQLAESTPILRLIRQSDNQGKGAAVKRGVLESKGRYILFADADGATPIGEATKLIDTAREGADVVIGSRTASKDMVTRSLLRSIMGALFYRLTNFLAVPAISDTQCGFKLFRRFAANKIFPLIAEKGWAFDVEVLFLAQKFGMAIRETPVQWQAIQGSKINPMKDSLGMMAAIMRIRRRASGRSN